MVFAGRREWVMLPQRPQLDSFMSYGNQVQENWDTAAQWYTKSAQQRLCHGRVPPRPRLINTASAFPSISVPAAQWYGRAAAQGDSQSAFFAKYIRDNPGIDTTWYSAQEKAIMAPYQMQPWMLAPTPDRARLP